MGTYIIHFDDKPWEDLDDGLYYRCFEIPWFSTTKTTISRLTPYTEDSAYAHGYTEAESKYREIRDELEKQAHQRGYKEAYDTAYADAEGIYESGKRAMYQKGLKDAWEAARKIALHPKEGGVALGDVRKIFGCNHFQIVFRDYSASEAIEKIRTYEQAQKEKEEQIQVGDEVIPRETEYDTMIVTRLWKDDYDSDCIDAIGFDGRIGSFLVSRVSKTGKHYEIAEVLAKMKESDNG